MQLEWTPAPYCHPIKEKAVTKNKIKNLKVAVGIFFSLQFCLQFEFINN